MRTAICGVVCLWLVAASGSSPRADSTSEFSVQASAAVQASPPQITLNWPQDSFMLPKSYTVFRKAPADSSWGAGITLAGWSTSYLDTNVTVGSAYEYQIIKVNAQYTGYGYLYAGINLPLTDNRGKLLLVVENTYAANLTNELTMLQQDLTGDGWTVIRLDVNRNDSVPSVKNQIKAQYNADPAKVKAVFLFGHVPVPYSGDLCPDGHAPDHQGAWPCDGYYGDMDGVWTDTTVNDAVALDARNRNVPGDGKFDQSTFPAPLKLMVGRVDLANMHKRLVYNGRATSPSEQELLRNYLNKEHKFRHKEFELPRRAILGDFFGVRNGEAFAASGWRNFSSFFGATNLINLPNQGTWVPALHASAALCAYGCGEGSFTSVSGLGNSDLYHDAATSEVVSNDIQAAFVLVFGSWLGDWDSPDNLMRAILALPSYGLASAWSGRPHWFLQHMALGETIGFGARLTQNNSETGLYRNQVNSCSGQIHIALMGDPTLRLHPVAPPTALTGARNGNTMTLNWMGSPDTIVGYHVYRASSADESFARLTSAPITATSYLDRRAPAGADYMVRAVKLESSGSGTYYNASQGAFLTPKGSPSDWLTAISPATNTSRLVR
jgi:hypothetical protein